MDRDTNNQRIAALEAQLRGISQYIDQRKGEQLSYPLDSVSQSVMYSVVSDSLSNGNVGAYVSSFGAKTRAITASTIQQFSDFCILANATSGAITLTLQPAQRVKGRLLYVKKTDASANAVTVDGSGSETIDGSATVSTTTRYVGFLIISDGTNWNLIRQ